MKMKKLLIVISILAVMFSLTGCGEEIDKPFEYDDTQIVFNTMKYFADFSTVPEEYEGYYMTDGSAFEKSAIQGIEQARNTDKVGAFEDYSIYNDALLNGSFDIKSVDAKITNTADAVSVTIVNHAKDRDVEITVRYVENAEYYIELDKHVQKALEYWGTQGYTAERILLESGCETLAEAFGSEYELQQLGLLPYVAEEMVVSAVYTKGELMKQAGMNTLIGMGTVFVVLIFISFIISLFKFLPALLAKKPKITEMKEEKTPAKAEASAPAAMSGDADLMNDAELVAVITAAIYAASGSGTSSYAGAVSKDRLVVRSIRRAKK